tara:strand:- start:343 stop:642 length:300 start_codon:yes stop_codon:yes gene_type:complete
MDKLIFILFILLVSCAPKKNFSLNDLEEIYNFKAKSVAYFENEKKENIHEFLVFDNSSSLAKQKALQKCQNFIISKKNDNLICKIKYIKITKKVETSLN